jgi:hypothetical protein
MRDILGCVEVQVYQKQIQQTSATATVCADENNDTPKHACYRILREKIDSVNCKNRPSNTHPAYTLLFLYPICLITSALWRLGPFPNEAS